VAHFEKEEADRFHGSSAQAGTFLKPVLRDLEWRFYRW
jgi:hypothetical protein